MKWLRRVLFPIVKPLVLDVVRRIIVDGSNKLIEGRLSENIAKRLDISDEKVDAVISTFAEALVEFAENQLEDIFGRTTSSKRLEDEG
ncbi:MAG: hypothetical protein KatS3mg054_0608 [Chloroflexus sp.]|nr:MAG: hypothetical protein KatS3mg054_0608 [Chloroflexus sp.]